MGLIFWNFVLVSTLCGMCLSEGISLTFVVDTTNSMNDDIEQVRAVVDSIMDIFVEKADQISDYILITFNDPDKATVRLNTTDPMNVTKALKTLVVDGGDDCAENALSGVKLALDSSQPGSYIYVFTDASAKDYELSEEIQQLCQTKQSQIVFIVALTGVCGKPDSQEFEVYYNITNAGMGVVIRVPKQDVEAVVKQFVQEDIKENTVIARELTPPHERTKVPFSIDELTTHAIVSVSGTDALNYYFNDPSFETETIVWTPHTKVIKIINPEPGDYTVSVKSSSPTSVVVTGRSDFSIRHGFSKRKPSSLNDTEPVPVADLPTRLSFLVTDPNYSVLIRSAQILHMNGYVIKELTLTELALNLYTTELFTAPSEMFKVAIIGDMLKTGRIMRRIVKIPIIPKTQPPEAPEVTGVENVEARVGTSVLINCNVIKGVPKPKLSWQFQPTDGNEFADIANSDSEWHISNATTEHSGIYKCIAMNSEGDDYHVIQLTVKEPAKTSNDKSLRLPCDTFSYPKPSVTWQVNGSPVIPGEEYDIEDGDLIIKNPTKSDNNYTCTATKSFKAFVDETSVNYGILRDVYLLQDHALKLSCNLPRVGSKSVAWYINDEYDGSYKADISVDNAEVGDDGNYTCHVADVNGSATGTFLVDVGYPPSFKFPQIDATISWDENTNYLLRCDAIAKPPADRLSGRNRFWR